MIPRRIIRLAALSVLAAASGALAEQFTVVALPDTQNYAKDSPAIFDAQTQWIADNAEAENILFVTHLGDIVNNTPDIQQWENAKGSMSILDDAGVPYGTAMGNHDTQGGDNGATYLQYFGPQFYDGQPWYGGASPTGLSNYQVFQAGGFTFIFIHLEVDSRPAEVAWAQQVIDDNPGAVVAVTTHRYVYDYRILAGRFNPFVYDNIDGLYYPDSVPADHLFETFISANPQIFMVQCGHVDGEFHLAKTNDAGLPVYEILADFQSSAPSGGDGWLRLLRFDTDANTVTVETFSPTVGAFRDVETQVADALTILDFGLDVGLPLLQDLLAVLEPTTIDLIVEVLFGKPGNFQLFVDALEVQDPGVIDLLVFALDIEADEIITLLDAFPWDALNDDFVAVVDEHGAALAPLVLDADKQGIIDYLSQNDGALVEQAFLQDPRRATTFTLDVPFADYAAAGGPCTGDADGDGSVGAADLDALLAAFGQTGDDQPADFNADGVVNSLDLNMLLDAYGGDC